MHALFTTLRQANALHGYALNVTMQKSFIHSFHVDIQYMTLHKCV